MKKLLLITFLLASSYSKAENGGGYFGKKWTLSGSYNLCYGQMISDFAKKNEMFKTIKNFDLRLERTLNRKTSIYFQNTSFISDFNLKYSIDGLSYYEFCKTFNNYQVFGMKIHSPNTGNINPIGIYYAAGVFFGTSSLTINSDALNSLNFSAGKYKVHSGGLHGEWGIYMPINRSFSLATSLSTFIRIPKNLLQLNYAITNTNTYATNLKNMKEQLYNRYKAETIYNIKIGVNFHF